MKIGEKIWTPRGEFEVKFKNIQEAEEENFQTWFCVRGENNRVIGKVVTRAVDGNWCEAAIALAGEN